MKRANPILHCLVGSRLLSMAYQPGLQMSREVCLVAMGLVDPVPPARKAPPTG